MIRQLFVPETASGRGSGHLVRCLELARLMPGSAFLIPAGRQEGLLPRYPGLAEFPCHASLPALGPLPDGSLPLVVFDLMELSPELVRAVLPQSLPVAIDARGEGLRLVPVLVDLLPRLAGRRPWEKANRTAPEFLPQAGRRRAPATGPLPADARVLISFGGEDAAGLGRGLAASGVLAACLPEARVSWLIGPLAAPPAGLPQGWQTPAAIPLLREDLHAWDLVITSFGLTAYEARSAGCRVLLCNPRAYHRRLAEKAGFVSASVGVPDIRRFRQALSRLETLAAGGPSAAGPGGEPAMAPDTLPPAEAAGLPGLAAWLSSLPRHASASCPGCRASANPVIARFAERSYFHCRECGLDYLQSFRTAAMAYDESYFFTDYQKQYGKTYLDDFAHIKSMGQARLDCLETLARRETRSADLAGRRLLDVGCAYGPFLAAAAERGLVPHGTDISPQAVGHVRTVLGYPAVAGDIRELDNASLGGPFDLVSLWYVIEHFPDLDRVLGRLAGLLVPGGWLAMATPSGEGISARRNHSAFLNNSPADHFTIWNPSRTAGLLARYGLQLRHVRVTGHHPERFPGLLGRAAFRPLTLAVSQRLGLGDTFEIYAVKLPSGSPAQPPAGKGN